jgi:hypothetical protein
VKWSFLSGPVLTHTRATCSNNSLSVATVLTGKKMQQASAKINKKIKQNKITVTGVGYNNYKLNRITQMQVVLHGLLLIKNMGN